MARLNEMDVDYQRKLKQLTPSNKLEFLKLRNALKYDFKVKERAADTVLSDILDHLLEAQKNGVSTKEFFGSDTRQFTNDLYNELPKNKMTHPLWYFIFILFLTIGSQTLPFGLISQIKFWVTGRYFPINLDATLLSLTVFIILLTTAIFITIHAMKNNIYSTNKGKLRVIPFYIAMIFIPLAIFFLNFDKNLSEPAGYILILIGILSLIIAVLTYKKKISY